MVNKYDEGQKEIATIFRENTEDVYNASSIQDIKGYETEISSDGELQKAIKFLTLQEELSEKDKSTLLSCFTYACKTVSYLGLDPNEAIWRKYYINLFAYATPVIMSSQEINRHAVLGGIYKEGIFDTLSKDPRYTQFQKQLKKEAYSKARNLFLSSDLPYGHESLRVIQLIFNDWLLNLGKDFSPKDIQTLLLGEINELKGTKKRNYFNTDQLWNRAYEACDVMIYILHMFSIYNLDITKEYAKKTN